MYIITRDQKNNVLNDDILTKRGKRLVVSAMKENMSVESDYCLIYSKYLGIGFHFNVKFIDLSEMSVEDLADINRIGSNIVNVGMDMISGRLDKTMVSYEEYNWSVMGINKKEIKNKIDNLYLQLKTPEENIVVVGSLIILDKWELFKYFGVVPMISNIFKKSFITSLALNTLSDTHADLETLSVNLNDHIELERITNKILDGESYVDKRKSDDYEIAPYSNRDRHVKYMNIPYGSKLLEGDMFEMLLDEFDVTEDEFYNMVIYNIIYRDEPSVSNKDKTKAGIFIFKDNSSRLEFLEFLEERMVRVENYEAAKQLKDIRETTK